jgi:hypothetical protein
VVLRLHAALKHAYRALGVQAGLCDRGQEFRFAYVVGARAGYQDSAGFQHFQRAQVDLFVGADRGFYLRAGFGEGGRVEDYRFVAAFGSGQEFEGVGFFELDVADPVRGCILRGGFESWGAGVYGYHRIGFGGHVDREAPGGGEDVERASASVLGGCGVVFALVEEDAGFLTVGEVDEELEAVHFEVDGRRDLALQEFGFAGEVFVRADRGVVSGDDAGGFVENFQGGDYVRCRDVHALVEGLDGEEIGVAVDDQGREGIGFCVDQAVSVGVVDDPVSVGLGGGDAGPEESGVGFYWLRGEQAEGNLGGGAVVCSSLDAAILRGDTDGIAGLGFACRKDVATEDPGVAAGYARDGFAIDGNGIQAMARSRAMRSSVLG